MEVTVLRRCRKCYLEAHNEEDLELFTKSKLGRYGRLNICKRCHNIITTAWQKRNPDKVRASHRRWHVANREKRNAYQRQWYADNREKRRIYFQKYREEHRDTINRNQREGRKRKRLKSEVEQR